MGDPFDGVPKPCKRWPWTIDKASANPAATERTGSQAPPSTLSAGNRTRPSTISRHRCVHDLRGSYLCTPADTFPLPPPLENCTLKQDDSHHSAGKNRSPAAARAARADPADMGWQAQGSRAQAEGGQAGDAASATADPGRTVSRACDRAHVAARLEPAQPALVCGHWKGGERGGAALGDAAVRVLGAGQSHAPGRRGGRSQGAWAGHERDRSSPCPRAKQAHGPQGKRPLRPLPCAHPPHPDRVRHAVHYVRHNFKKHVVARGETLSTGYVDPFSSLCKEQCKEHGIILPPAETWLLRTAVATLGSPS